MKYRIAGWAGTGLLVAGCWALYFLGANQDSPTKPTLSALVRLSCPIALVRSYPLSGLWLLSPVLPPMR
jgi:hypothetical protein